MPQSCEFLVQCTIFETLRQGLSTGAGRGGAARQVAQALNDEATFLLSQMANFAAQAKNRDGFAPEWRPVQQIRRICGGIRRD
jgi:hypothetical protein